MNTPSASPQDQEEQTDVKQITEEEAKELRETLDKLDRLNLDALPVVGPAQPISLYTTRLSNTTCTTLPNQQ